jgi:hypothetical protein
MPVSGLFGSGVAVAGHEPMRANRAMARRKAREASPAPADFVCGAWPRPPTLHSRANSAPAGQGRFARGAADRLRAGTAL